MLPRHARLTSANEFARTTKSGFRLSSRFLVVYLYQTTTTSPAKAGLIINKSVGGSVVRHKVARQIRHALMDHMQQIPEGALVVVRALPGVDGQNVRDELGQLIPRVLTKAMVAK